MNMKKLVLACALLSSAVVYAHSDDHQPPSAEARATHMQKVLQLSDEQTAKLKKVLETDAQQRKALHDKYEPQFESFHTDMRKQHEQTKAQVKTVLSPKQQQALDALHDDHGMSMHEDMGMMGMDGMHGEQCPMHDKDMHEDRK